MEMPQALQDKVKKFAKEITSEDELGAVIRAQLHIERVLNSLIDHKVVEKKHLPKSIDYFDKIRWALAFGLDPALRTPLEKIGNIRNNYAHLPDYTMDRALLVGAYKAADEEFRAEIEKSLRSMFEVVQQRVRTFHELEPRDMFSAYALQTWTRTYATVANMIGQVI